MPLIGGETNISKSGNIVAQPTSIHPYRSGLMAHAAAYVRGLTVHLHRATSSLQGGGEGEVDLRLRGERWWLELGLEVRN